MKLWERKAFWLSAKKGFFTAQMINTHLSLSAAERKRGPVVQMCAWDAGALQIFNGWSHLPNHPNFPHDREKRSCPRPFSARMFDSIEGLSSRERSFWNAWKAELCLVSTQAEDGSVMPSMQVWTVGFRSAGDVTQHWCLAPLVKWGLTGASAGWISSHSTGELHSPAGEANTLLSRKGWISQPRAFKQAPFQEPHPIPCPTQHKCVSRVTCCPAPLDPMQWLLKFCFNNNNGVSYLHRSCEWNRAHRPKGDDWQE